MTEIDWIIAAVLAISTCVGIYRGVIRETLAIAGWIIGVVLAVSYAGELADKIPLDSIGYLPKVLISAVLIVVGVLFTISLLGAIVRSIMAAAELTFEDRALGAVFGLVRGAVVVCAAVFLFGMLPSVQENKMWNQSALIAPAQALIEMSMPYLPEWIQDLHEGGEPAMIPVDLDKIDSSKLF